MSVSLPDPRGASRLVHGPDGEVVESPEFHLRDLSVTFRSGEEVDKVEVGRQATVTSLASEKRIPAETIIYSAGLT